MKNWPVTDDRPRGVYARNGAGGGVLPPMARWFYRRGGTYPGGQADPRARRLARLWAAVIARGLLPERWVTLEVAGRRSGRVTRFPLGMADWNGQWYLVSMLGERCNWVQNVRAAHGRATLRGRCAGACCLAEVPLSERPPIIKRYLQKVPGARPHIPVSRHAPIADVAAIAPYYPVFQVVRPCDPGGTLTAARPAATPIKESFE